RPEGAHGARPVPLRLRDERVRRGRRAQRARLDRGAVHRGVRIPGAGVRDPRGRSLTGADQPAGVPGEILVRSYMTMQGYYGKPAETAQALDRDGWLHSGDMGVMREDGHLRFMGRYKDMLKIGGENVDPMEVEAFLMSLGGVNLAAVVSFPDARLAEV